MIKNYILFGPPGAGKGTQCKLIAQKYNLYHISTGDLIREEQTKGTTIGKLATELSDKGNFLPDDIVTKLVKEKIMSVKDSNGFLFDGYPRTVEQAKALDSFMHLRKTPITSIIHIKVDDPIITERIIERGRIQNRPDDKPEIILTRIKNYNDKTLPILDYFKGRKKIVDINGNFSVDNVFNNIESEIESI